MHPQPQDICVNDPARRPLARSLSGHDHHFHVEVRG